MFETDKSKVWFPFYCMMRAMLLTMAFFGYFTCPNFVELFSTGFIKNDEDETWSDNDNLFL